MDQKLRIVRDMSANDKTEASACLESPKPVEIVTPEQLAENLKVPVSWVYNHTRPCTSEAERMPQLKLGKYTRFRWGSPELTAWLHSLEAR